MSRISKAFWIWCDFIEEDIKFLKQIQSKLYESFNSPFFDLHMTLHGPFLKRNELNKKKIYKICKNIKKIPIEAKNYKISDNFFKSFYIEVLKSEKLIELRNTIYREFPINFLYEFIPHISMIYGNFNESEKLKNIRNLPIIKKKIFTIKNIVIADVDENINKWKIIERIELK